MLGPQRLLDLRCPLFSLTRARFGNAGIELDGNPFARVEGVRMLKPAVKKGKVRPAQENGFDDDK